MNQWHTKQLDGHYWATTTGKNKKLMGIGVWKVLHCKGPLFAETRNA